MAKKDVRTIDVTGLSIKDIMNIDLDTFNRLGEKDLRAITSRLVSASNKRIRRMKESGLYSPAVTGLGTDVYFSVKLPSNVDVTQRINKLRSEFARSRSFLTKTTSTIGGVRRYQKKQDEEIEKIAGKKLTKKEKESVYSVLHKAQERGDVDAPGTQGSKQARDYLLSIYRKANRYMREEKKNIKNEILDELIMDLYEEENDYFES